MDESTQPKKLTVREERDRYQMALSIAMNGLETLEKSEGWSKRQRRAVANKYRRSIENVLKGEQSLLFSIPDSDGYEHHTESAQK